MEKQKCRILEANGEGDKPQSFGDWLADKIAADIKKLDTTPDENDAFHRAAVEKLSQILGVKIP
jgi:hypothetical protein